MTSPDAYLVTPIIERVQQAGIRCSLFVDPNEDQVLRAADTGVQSIELYTEAYAKAFKAGRDVEPILEHYMRCTEIAHSLGLRVNAGHDLDLDNVAKFVSNNNITEVSIGHALTVEALTFGFAETIKRYVTSLNRVHQKQ